MYDLTQPKVVKVRRITYGYGPYEIMLEPTETVSEPMRRWQALSQRDWQHRNDTRLPFALGRKVADSREQVLVLATKQIDRVLEGLG